MPNIIIKEVRTNKDLMDFVKFPMKLYKDNPYFVPPLINDEKNIWNANENPALQYSEAKQFLALKNNEVVGRVAVMINHKEARELGISKVRFGWLDFIDDEVVSKALIDVVIDYARAKNIHKIEGPMGFTNLDKAGMLTMGFDQLATMIGIYNAEYYPIHMEKLGFKKEKEWVEFEIVFPEKLDEKIVKFNKIISEKYHLNVVKFKNKKAAAFGSYGWSGDAPKLISEHLKEGGFELVDDGFKTLWVPDEEALAACREYGKAFAKATKYKLQSLNGRMRKRA